MEEQPDDTTDENPHEFEMTDKDNTISIEN